MTQPAPNRLTPSLEDSLKVIYQLAGERDPVTTADVAAVLNISQSSATELFRRLAEQELVSYTPYRGASLTGTGRSAALAVVRRHRLIETFLVDTLGYGWDEVHADADTLEHALSPRLEARLAAHLGHPATDPHGDPIPTAEGAMPPDATIPLTELALETPARLTRVGDQAPELLAYLGELGLMPGVLLVVCRREPFDGPLTLQVADQSPVIAVNLARTLFVIPQTEEQVLSAIEHAS